MRHTRLKYLADVIPGQSPSSTEVSYLDEGLPFIQGNAEFGKLTPNPVWQCDESPKIAKTGDVLVSVRAPVGAVNIAAQPIGIGRGVAAIRPKKSILSKWIYWALIAHKQDLLAAATGSTFSAVSGTDVGNLRLSLSQDPAVVAEFLDRETAEIDAFIADQERLIELLEERRAATITHAVTKGLDPNAPTTDSGIDWLGTVPYHWSIRKLKTLANLTTAKTDNQLFSLGLEHVQSWTGELNVESLDGEVATQGIGFQKNDVLFGKLRPNLAKVWVATRSGTAIGDFLVIRPGSELAPKFLGYLMRTPSFISVVVGSMYGAKMPRTSWDFVKNIAWSIPSIKEQKTIVEFLNLETAKIDAAVSDAREAIALSRERRAALISAAVTGQLDVSQAQRPVDEVLEQGVQV